MIKHILGSTLVLLGVLGCDLSTEPDADSLELAFEVTPVTTAGGSDGAIDLTVTGGESPYEFSWSNGAVTEDIANLVVGVYTVQVQSHDGQSLVDSAAVELLSDSNMLTDVDGNTYPTVQIGDQLWLAENFRATHAADGTVLTGVYVYNNDAGNVAEYGRLYTWDAAQDACPDGWHLPTDEEWNVLETWLGAAAGTRLKTGGDTGFNAKIAGYRDAAGGYDLLGSWTMFWSATYYTNDHAYVRNLFQDQDGIVRSGVDVNAAVSVRYIRDN